MHKMRSLEQSGGLLFLEESRYAAEYTGISVNRAGGEG